MAYAPPGICSPHGVIWWSNEIRNAKGVAEGASRKKRGVIAGVPDIFFHSYRHSTQDYFTPWIELKVGKRPLSTPQKKLHPEMRRAGIKVYVCRSLEDVRLVLRNVPRTREVHEYISHQKIMGSQGVRARKGS